MAKKKSSSTKKKPATSVVPTERIERAILLLRGQKVLLDSELAALYGVETGALVRQMKRNIERFPADFMFQLSDTEWEVLRCQIGTSKGSGGRRYAPYAFTEQGVAMLSSVLRSPQAVEVNIEIMRTFVRLRELVAKHKDLARKLNDLEKKYDLLIRDHPPHPRSSASHFPNCRRLRLGVKRFYHSSVNSLVHPIHSGR